jgi:hypothetical protein
MKRRTGRASLLHPLTLLPSPSQPSISFFPNYYDIFGLFFALYRGGRTCRRATAAGRVIPPCATTIWLAAVAHDGLTLTAVGHGGWPPNPWGPTSDIWTVVAHDGNFWNRRGPRRPSWATTNGYQKCKIFKPSYIFAKWFINILKKFLGTAQGGAGERAKAGKRAWIWLTTTVTLLGPQTKSALIWYCYIDWGSIWIHGLKFS